MDLVQTQADETNFRKTTSCISSDIRKPFDCQWPILTSCRTTTVNLFPTTISKHIPIKKAWKCIDMVMVRCSWIPDHFAARICRENGVWIRSFRAVLSLLCFLPSQTYIFLGAFTWGRVIIPFGYGYTCKKDYAHAEIAFSGIPGNVLSDTPLMSRPAWCRPYPKGWYEPGITGDVFMEQSIKGFAWPKSSQWDDNISLHVVPIWISLPSSSPSSSSSSSTTYSRWCFQPMS